MPSKDPQNHETRFVPFHQEKLSRCVIGAKVPIDVEQAVRALPSDKRSEWIRRVITEAARRELMGNNLPAPTKQ